MQAEPLIVEIKTSDEIKRVEWYPSQTRVVGHFDLAGGKNSYLDILTPTSGNLLAVDALEFSRQN